MAVNLNMEDIIESVLRYIAPDSDPKDIQIIKKDYMACTHLSNLFYDKVEETEEDENSLVNRPAKILKRLGTFTSDTEFILISAEEDKTNLIATCSKEKLASILESHLKSIKEDLENEKVK